MDNPEPRPDPPAGPRPWRVDLLLWDGVELLDFAGPGEVLGAAGFGDAFRIRTLSPDGKAVVSQGFLRVEPHGALELPSRSRDAGLGADLIVVPGGASEAASTDSRILDWLRHHGPRAHHILSVCTGALVLAAAGLLKGRPATTWRGALPRLRELDPSIEPRPGDRWVTGTGITTAAGVSAGIDAALFLVESWLGEEEACRIVDYMEYRPSPRTGSA